MSFHEKFARFSRLHQENRTWKLLKADNAPLLLAFIAELFRETNEVPFGKAIAILDTELNRLREYDQLDGEVKATAYLRQWIQDGWLRELNDLLTRTDACELAMRFVKGLEERGSNATASHLRIVQDAVRDLAVALSPDPKERIILLESRKAELQREIDDLEAGVVYELPEAEQRERIQEVYQLASLLTGDFRRVEDEIRHMDQKLRVEMIESENHRGDILESLLEKENILAESDAGRAFDGFFQLLCDTNRRMEFKEQLRSVLSRPAAAHLSKEQCRYLERLLKELNQESHHVFRVRNRTEESLRNYVESGAHLENRAVNQLLEQLEQTALALREQDISLKVDTGLRLNAGSAKITSLDSFRLRVPEEAIDTSNIASRVNESTPSDAMLEHLQSVKVAEVAENIKSLLEEHGPLTIAGIIKELPISEGIEELVAYMRVAQAVSATTLNDRENVVVYGSEGECLQASIPCYLLSADQFPERIEELSL
ncbi:DUF3375 domain-containing protein [Endozoicomonas atrinae]|uniref:DUF3375 domain-containing protein n=1 Tax=Endozoicomonas atrinae TaxID=1333660 RepID=UPI000826B306|nr:DUF3375 domain-containing protein [Endozoicomonas atrinae]